jgi:hypothetical protein
MGKKPDIIVSTRQGRQLAVVEVKNLPGLSLEDAVALRDAIVEPPSRPVRYVLVVSQAKGFLWRWQEEETRYGEAEELDMGPVLREYVSDGELNRHIRGADLDLVLSHWLGELARGRVARPGGVSEQGPFVQFISDIRGAQINLEALA